MAQEGGPKCRCHKLTHVSLIHLQYLWPLLLKVVVVRTSSVSIGSGEPCDSWNDIMQH